jgi:hypothetical protein
MRLIICLTLVGLLSSCCDDALMPDIPTAVIDTYCDTDTRFALTLRGIDIVTEGMNLVLHWDNAPPTPVRYTQVGKTLIFGAKEAVQGWTLVSGQLYPDGTGQLYVNKEHNSCALFWIKYVP